MGGEGGPFVVVTWCVSAALVQIRRLDDEVRAARGMAPIHGTNPSQTLFDEVEGLRKRLEELERQTTVAEQGRTDAERARDEARAALAGT